MSRKTRLITAALLAMLLAALAGAALAANLEVTFTWTVDGHAFTVLMDKQEKGGYVLYLPGALKNQEPVFSANQDREMTWDGVTYRIGDAVPVSKYAGQTVEVAFSGWNNSQKVKVMQGSDIPAMQISLSADDLKRISVKREVDIKEPADLLMIAEDGSLNAAESLDSFKTRGNSTFFAQKKPFSLRMEHKADLGGMGKNKKWILLANWYDISLIRNQITFDLFRYLGMTYTPDCRQVDLYLNRKYNGTYLLTEKIQLKQHRLEISDLEEEYEALNGQENYDNAKARYVKYNGLSIRWYDLEKEPEDITGGYLLELEKPLYYSEKKDHAGVKTETNMCVTIKEPTHVGQRGAEYLADLMNGFHNATIAENGLNSEGKYYADYIDMHSFALKAAVDEFCVNYDVRAASQFMYKEKDSIDPLLHAGPPWDYDWSYGNHSDGAKDPELMDYVYKRSGVYWFLTHWLLTHEDFQQATRRAYEEEVYPAAEILLGRKEAPEGSALKTLEEYRAAIADSAEMNFTRWRTGGVPDIYKGSGMSFEEAYAYLKHFIEVRTDALMENWTPGRNE